MSPGDISYLDSDLGKYWPEEFAKRRKHHHENYKWATEDATHGPFEDILGIFADLGGTAFPFDIEVLEKFCLGRSRDDVVKGNYAGSDRKAVWLDERDGYGPQGKRHSVILTASELLHALTIPRFGHGELPDAARRLIYISDLDPACIHALRATASFDGSTVLKNALYKHLAFQASIAVKIPSTGYLTFELDLHLPFFLLNYSKPQTIEGEVNTKPKRQWTDLSFLMIDKAEADGVWGIHEAQISLVITGQDNWQWVGYSFVDAEIDGALSDLTSEDLVFDQIAAGLFDADLPFLTPREYWVKVLEVRIEQIRQHWEHLIYKVKSSVTKYNIAHPITLPRHSEARGDTEDAFNWTLQAIALLQKIRSVLLCTVKEWKSFSAAHGDIRYFPASGSQCISESARRSMQAVNRAFKEMQGYLEDVVSLNYICSHHLETLKIRLAREGTEAAIRMAREGTEAADHNWATAEFTTSLLYPVALTTAIFSMEPTAMPFVPNRTAFGVALLVMIVLTFIIRLVFQRAPPYWMAFQKRIVAIWFKKGTRGWLQVGGKTDGSPNRKRRRDLVPDGGGGFPYRDMGGTEVIEMDGVTIERDGVTVGMEGVTVEFPV